MERGYDLGFKVVGGAVTRLRARVRESCAGESSSDTTTIASDARWRVSGTSFSKRIEERLGRVTAYTTFEDRFTSPTTAVGAVRQETVAAGAVCDAYKLT